MLKFLLSLCLVAAPLTSMAIEEPDYEVVQRLDGAEVRLYAPYVVAQVMVSGSADQAGSRAFPILAGYIFGKNRGATKFDMTAPVTQAAVPSQAGATPVAAAGVGATGLLTGTESTGDYVVQFVLPKGVTPATAPEPVDPRVQVREVPGGRVAVIRYTGFWSQANFEEHLGKLEAALRVAGLSWTGEPTLSRYNAPFTPWFMRRNEVWLKLGAPSPGEGPH